MVDNRPRLRSGLLYHPSNRSRMELHVGRKIFLETFRRRYYLYIICILIILISKHIWKYKAHQTHHSSEYYNLSTALRQSMWHKYFTFPTYLPLALIGIPPSQMLLHREMNLLYQFWVHTTQIPKLWVSYTKYFVCNRQINNFLVANRIYFQHAKSSSSSPWSKRILVTLL